MRQKERVSSERGVPVYREAYRRLRAIVDKLLHVRTATEPVWRYFWPVLALAFAARAAVALSGDFLLHSDEVMQYLEQGHRLVFGNGIIYWEFFYGARSWLVPGLIAGVLTLFDAVGLGQPAWYVNGVKLVFCAISLLIPAGMYFFSRRHFGETAARGALLAGAFWYELVSFAHKPLTGLVATAVLMALLALCVRPFARAEADVRNKLATVWLIAFLVVLAASIRMQYAPLALALLGLFFLHAGRASGSWWQGIRTQLALVATVLFLAVGAFDAVTWDAEPFHSYLANLWFNLALEEVRAGSSPAWQYLWWCLLASAGLSALCLAMTLRDMRRYGFLLLLITLALFIHSSQAHKEYRFVFVVIPLWLLIGTDLVARFADRMNKPSQMYGASGVAFVAVSLAGILNALPYQDEVYKTSSTHKDMLVRFIRDQDPIFAAYRYLASAPDVLAVWQTDRPYYNLPGYYYLHRKIPFYDALTGSDNNLHKDLKTLQASVTHIVSGDSKLTVPGYVVEKEFGNIRILHREENDPPIRRWQNFTPIILGTESYHHEFMYRMYPDAPPPPPASNIRFVEPE